MQCLVESVARRIDRGRGCSVANEIDRDDPVITGNIAAKWRPGCRAAGKTMQEHERGTVAIVLDAELNTVGANDAHLKLRPGRPGAAPPLRLPRSPGAASHFARDR